MGQSEFDRCDAPHPHLLASTVRSSLLFRVVREPGVSTTYQHYSLRVQLWSGALNSRCVSLFIVLFGVFLCVFRAFCSRFTAASRANRIYWPPRAYCVPRTCTASVFSVHQHQPGTLGSL